MSIIYDELRKQADVLQLDEQLRLAAYLLERARSVVSRETQPYKWRDICGRYPYPMLGEDAQTWVTRTRCESDAQREAQWRE